MVTRMLLGRIKSLFFLLGTMLIFITAVNSANAAISNISSTTFSCDELYGSTDNAVYKVNTSVGTSSLLYRSSVYVSTIALGRPSGRDSGLPLRMYGWAWGYANTDINYVQSGATTDVTGAFNTRLLGTGTYSGGEINQLTGEMYFSGAEGGYLHNGFYYATFNPITGQVKRSAANLAAKPGSTASTLVYGGVVSSDMAIDAEGNIYSIIHSGTTSYLIKVEVGAHNATWYYEIVAPITGLPSTNVWGMAFLNGKLYAAAGNRIYSVSVLTGTASVLSGTTTGSLQDLASCQVAPVIRGKIYNDTTGEGNISGSEAGVSGVKVELWKGSTYYKTFTTSATGEYSFIVDSTNAQDYHIRLNRPTVSGVNAIQTWASSDSSSVNPVAAYCSTADGTIDTLSSDGACRGTTIYAPLAGTNVSNSVFYTKITMNSDAKVANASFALTTVSNFGDAPSAYNASTPAKHVSPGASGPDNELNWLRLGDQISTQTAAQSSTDANAIATHDGLEVALKGTSNFVSLQDAMLVSGKTYTFRAKTSGPGSDQGYLSGWIDWSSSKNTGNTFGTQIIKDEAGVKDGYVTFDYTVPSGSASGLHETFARFRFSTTQGLGATNATLPTPSATVPWVVDGEVEDYRVYITTGSVQLGAISKGGTGKFDYALSNVSTLSPSTAADTITTASIDSVVNSTQLHAFNSVGQDIVITQTLPDVNWGVISAECKDGSSVLTTTLDAENGKLTIPASSVKEGASLVCTFTNGTIPKITLNKTIAGSRFDTNDQFNIQLKDSKDAITAQATTAGTATTAAITATKVNADETYTLTEVMTATSKSTLARYQTAMSCTNVNSSSSTTLPSGTGQTFTLTPVYGDDISCTLTNTSIVASLTTSEIKADPDSIIADGGLTSTSVSVITVTMKDSNGVQIPVGGDKVEIYFTDPANQKGVFKGPIKDNGDGTYSIELTSTQRGSDTFSYKVNDVAAPADKTATVTYTAGAVDATKSELTADPTSIPANDETTAKLTVKLKDANGNYLTSGVDENGAKYVVTLFVDPAAIGTFSPNASGEMVNNDDGTFTAYVKSTQSGSDVIKFRVGTDEGGNSETIEYTVGPADVGSSVLSATLDTIKADGKETSIVKVQLVDKFGNLLTSNIDPVTGLAYDVKILVKNDPKITPATITTVNNNDGTFTAVVTSTKTGVDTFTFEIGTEPSTAEKQITYKPGDIDLTKSTINADPDTIEANGESKSTITVQLKDANENLIILQSGTVKIQGVNIAQQGAGKTEIEATYANGAYTLVVTSIKSGKDENITFTLDGKKGDDHTFIEYTPGEVDLTQSEITLSKDPITADNDDSSIVKITLKDANGNLIKSSGGQVELIFNKGNGPIGIPTAVKDNGDGTYTATIKSTKTGQDLIGYRLDENESPVTKPLTYNPGKVDLSKSKIWSDPSEIAANDDDEAVIYVQLMDANDNKLTTNEGSVVLSGHTFGVVLNGPVTNGLSYKGQGLYQGSVKSSEKGTDTFNFSLAGTPAPTTVFTTVTYKVGGPSLTKSTISRSEERIQADGQEETIISVQLIDDNGLFLDDAAGRVFLTGLVNGQTKPAQSEPIELTYQSGGRYTVTVVSEKADFDTFGYKLGEDAATAKDGSGKVKVTYIPGPIDFDKSTITAIPPTITADGKNKSTIIVTLMDKFDNVITTDQGKITLTGLNIGYPFDTTNTEKSLSYNGDGTYSIVVVSKKSDEDATIGFTVASLNNPTSKTTSIKYTPGTVSLDHSLITASLSSIVADHDQSSVITIQFRDANGNKLSGDLPDGVLPVLTGVGLGLGKGEIKVAMHPMGNGAYQAEVYSQLTGTDNIGFTLNGTAGAKGETVPVEYTPGDADLTQSELIIKTPSVKANGTTSKIVLQLKDKFGNKLTAGIPEDVSIFIASSTVTGALDRLSNFTNVGDGTYTSEAKSMKSGVDTISFSIDGVAAAVGQSKTVTYTAGTANAAHSIIESSPDTIEADGSTTSTLTVRLKDANDNPLTASIGNAVTISAPVKGMLDDSTPSVVDNQDGTYSIKVKSEKTGTDTFSFAVLGVANTSSFATVEYTPGDVDLSESVISANPVKVMADGKEYSEITVQLKDKFGNDLKSNPDKVTLTGIVYATQKELELTAVPGTGKYTGKITSTDNGTDTINFKLGSTAKTDKPVNVEFKSGGASLNNSTITVSPQEILANGTTSATVTIQLLDAQGNNTDNGEVVKLTGIAADNNTGLGVLTSAGFTNQGNGKWVGYLTSTKSGTDQIGFTIDGDPARDAKSLTYVAGPPSALTSEISVSPSPITADGSKATVVVQLRDVNNNKVVGEVTDAVTLLLPTPSLSKTDDGNLTMRYNTTKGVYEIEISSTQTGTEKLEYKLGSNLGSKSTSIEYIAGAVDLDESKITATPEQITANGEMVSVIKVQLKDKNGNLITANKGAVSFLTLKVANIKSPFKFNSAGYYEAEITSSQKGFDEIGYSLQGYGDGKDKVTVTYVAGDASMKESIINATPTTTIKADGKESTTIYVQLYDAKGNLITENKGDVYLTGLVDGGLVNPQSGSEIVMSYVGNGRYELGINSTEATSEKLGFLLDTAPGENSVTITYTPGDVDLTKSVIWATEPEIIANGQAVSIINVQLKDAHDNDIVINSGTVRLINIQTGMIDGNEGKSTVVLTSFENGVYSGKLTSTAIGSDTIGFSLEGTVVPGKAATVKYRSGPIDMSQSLIKVSKSKITADGKETSIITVQLRDSDGNDVDSDLGTVELEGIAKGIPEAGNSKTNVNHVNGTYTMTVTSTESGTDTITFIFTPTGGSPISDPTKKATIEYVAGSVDTSKSSIGVDFPSITANGSTTSTITVTLKDTNGNLIKDSNLQVQLIQGGDVAGDFVVVTPQNDGVYQYTVTSRKTGSDKFTYQYNNNGAGWLDGAGEVSVEYTAGLVDLTESSFVVDRSIITADGQDEAIITVTLKDANGNLVTTGDVSLIQGGDSVGTYTAVTPQAVPGVFKYTVTSYNKGSDEFTYQYKQDATSALQDGSGKLTVTYNLPLAFADKSSITVDRASITADGKDEAIVTVKLYQVNDDTVPLSGLSNTQLTLILKGGGTSVGSFAPAAAFEPNPGEYKFVVTSGDLGNDDWTFTTGGANVGKEFVNVKYEAGTDFDTQTSTITATDPSITADGQDSTTVTVALFYASDANKRIEKLTASDLTLMVKANGGQSVGSAVATTLFEVSPGVYTFTITSGAVGNDDWYFKLGSNESTAFANVAYTAGTDFDTQTSTITATDPSITADGQDSTTVTVALFYASDANKRIEKLTASDLTLMVKANGGQSVGSAVATTLFEVSPGVYTFTITSGAVGNDDWYFKLGSNESTAFANVAYTAGTDFDTQTSTITATDPSITADGQDSTTVTVALFYASDANKRIEKLTASDLTLMVKANGGQSVGSAVATTLFEVSPGVYTFTITSGAVGNDDWYFKLGSNESTAFANVAYTAGTDFDTQTSTITATDPSITADGQDSTTVTVALFYASDANKRIEKLTASDLTLMVKANGGQSVGSAVATTLFEVSPGVYTFTITSGAVGNDDWYFKLGSNESTAFANVAYTAGTDFDTQTSTITAADPSITADGQDSTTVTVALFYASDANKRIEKLTASDLTLMVKANGGQSVGSAVATTLFEVSPGVYTFTITSGAVGNDDWYFKLGSNESTAFANVAYTAGTDFDTQTSTITATDPSITADGQDSTTVTVALFYASDANKRIEKLTASDLTLMVKANGGQSVGSAVATTLFEVSPGVYTFTITSGAVGNDDWYFKLGSNESTAFANVAYTAGTDFDTQTSTITATDPSITADGQDSTTVTVALFYASDANKRIEKLTASDLTLMVKANGGQSVGSAVATTLFEVSPGVYTFTITSGAVGNDDWYFKLGSNESTAFANVAYTAGTDFDTQTSTITATDPSITADGQDSTTVTVALFYASDANKRIEKLTASDLTLMVKANGGQSVGSAVATTLFEVSPGVYTFTITSGAVGNDDWYFKLGSNESTAFANVAYTAGTDFDTQTSTITATDPSITADGQDSTTVTVALFYASDANKRIEKLTASDLTLMVKANGGQSVGSAVATTLFEVSPGVYTFTITSGAVGNDDWYFKLGSNESTAFANVAYTAGTDFDTQTSTITATDPSITADGQDSTTVTVALFYASDANKRIEKLTASDLTLMVKANGGQSVGSAVATTLFEVSPGVYTFTITSGAVGNDDWYFKLGSNESTAFANVAYTAGTDFDTQTSTITATDPSITADGQDSTTVTVALFYASDANKRIEKLTASDLTLMVKANGGQSVGSAVATTLFEVSPGVYTFTITSGAVGNDDWYFKLGSNESTAFANVAYTAGTDFDTQTSTITATDPSITADGQDSTTVTVALFYASDANKRIEKLTASDLTLMVKANGGQSVGSAVATTLFEVSPGVYTFTITSGAVGNDDWYFKLGSNESTAFANVAYTAGTDFDTQTSTITATDPSITADGQDSTTVTVALFYASDANKRIEKLTASDLTLMVKANGGQSVGSAVATTLFEVSPGVYTFTITSGAVGNDDWYFKLGSNESTAFANVAYTAGTDFDTQTSTITATDPSITADGQDSTTVTVALFYASDANKRIEKLTASDLTLMVKANGGQSVGSAVATTLFEVSPGVYTFTITSGTVGNDDWYFKLGSNESTAFANVAYTAGTDFDTQTSTITATDPSITADGQDSTTVTVALFYASDANKRIEKLTASDLTLMVKANGGQSVGSAVATTLFEVSPGVYTFTITSGAVGNDDWYFKLGSNESTAFANVAYTAGTDFDTQTSTITATDPSITADGQDSTTVTVALFYASDANKRIEKLTASDLTLMVKANGGQSVGSAVATTLFEVSPGVYTFTITSGAVGNDDWYFKLGSNESTAFANVAYTAGTDFDTQTSTITATDPSITADGQDSTTVTVALFYASDANKRIEKLTASDLTLMVKANGGQSVGSAVATTLFEVSPGVYTFTITSGAVGNDDWYFKLGSNESTAFANVAYTAGTDFDTQTSTITAADPSITADGQDSTTVTVALFYASDANKRIEKLTASDLTLMVKANGGQSVGSAVATTLFEVSPGVYTFTITSGTVGNDDWYFKLGSNESTAFANVAYTAGTDFDTQTSTITATDPSITADGQDSTTVTVALFYASDANKRIEKLTASDLTLMVKANGGQSVGSAVATTLFEVSPGVYTFTITSGAVGNDDWYFKLGSNESTAFANVAYTAGTDFDTQTSTITATDPSITADGQDSTTVTVALFYASDANKRIEKLTASDLTLMVKANGGQSVGSAVATTLFEVSPGVYTFTITSGAVGNDDWYFKLGSNESTAFANVAYTAGTDFDTQTSTITATDPSITADGQDSTTVTVALFYASDANKRIEKLTASDLTLMVKANGGQSVGSAVATTLFEVSPGVYTFTITSGTVGNDDWYFKLGSNESTVFANVEYKSGTGFDTMKSIIKTDLSTIAADDIEFATVTVELFYASDNTKRITGLTSADLELFADGTQTGKFTPSAMFETSPGVYEFTVTSDTEGNDIWKFKTATAQSNQSVTIEYQNDADLLVTISTKESEVKIGDVVLFTITAENKGTSKVAAFNVLQELPAGFSYVASSAAFIENPRGTTLRTVGNSPLSLENLSLNAGEKLTINVVLRVGAGVKSGIHTTYAQAFSVPKTRATTTSTAISNRASAVVTVTDSDPLFDESLIVGTVYHDRNGNGMQDPGEPGIPGVKVVSAQGLIITTDQYGRYHLEGILGGKWDRGRNFILKVDPASLPSGTVFVSKNPLVRRITPGLPVRFDFGIKLPEAFIMEVNDKLFVEGKSTIKPAYTELMSEMAESIKSNNIKEVVIVTEAKEPLAIQREEALREILNAILDESSAVVVSSINSQETK